GPSEPRRRWLRPLRILLWLIAQLVILALVVLGFVLGTQSGLRAAVAIAEDLAPDRISVDRTEGRILGALRITGLRLDLPGLELDLGSLYLDWRPAALIGGRLEVVELTGADIAIAVEPGPEKAPEPFEPPRIELPIGVEIGRVLVERLSFTEQGAPPQSAIRLERAELSATAVGDRLELHRLDARLSQPMAEAEATGSARLTGDYPLSLDLSWRFEQAPALRLSGAGTVSGDLQRLEVAHHVSGSAELELEAQIRSVLDAPNWEGQILLSAVRLPEIVDGAPTLHLAGELHTAGGLDDATLTGRLLGSAPDLPDVGELQAELDIGWAAKVLAVRTLRLGEDHSGARLNLAGTLDLNGRQPVFALAGFWERLRWPLAGDAVAEVPTGRLEVGGDLEAFWYSMAAQVSGPRLPEMRLVLSGTGNAEGTDLAGLSIDTLGGRIDGKGRVEWSPMLSWDLALVVSEIDPGVHYSGLDGRVGLKAESRGGLDAGYGFRLKVDADISAYPAAVLNLAGTGGADQVKLESLSIETLGGLVQGTGHLLWSPTLRWDLSLDADDLDPGRHYPDLGGRVALKLRSSGGLEAGYRYSLDGGAELRGYPRTVLSLAGTGDGVSTRLETLSVEVLGGRIDGAAELAWAPVLRWDAGLELAGLDPGTVLADWPGRIGGGLESSGEISEAGPAFTARVIDLAGELRGYPVRVQVDTAVGGGFLELRRLLAESATTRFSADGRVPLPAVGETDGAPSAAPADLRFALDSPDLSALLPGARGSLSANGSIGGTLSAPAISLRLEGRDAALAGQGIERIAARADIDLGAGGPVTLDVDGENLFAGGQRFAVLRVIGRGSIGSHRLDASLEGDALSLSLGAVGALEKAGSYRGALEQLELASEGFGSWELQERARYSFEQGRISVGPVCIGNGDDSGGCAELQQQAPGELEARLDVPRIGLEVLSPVLPEMLAVNGFVRAEARFRRAGGMLSGTARVQLPEGRIGVALAEAKDELVFSGAGADLRLDDSGLTAELAVPLQEVGSIDARVALPGLGGPAGGDPALRGDVAVRLDGLARVARLLPDVTAVSGSIDGDARLSGTLGQPQVSARLAVRDLGLTVPLIGLEIAQASLTLESQTSSLLTVDGSALVGGGRLEIDGTAQMAEQGPSVKVDVRGDQLKVADSKEYFALVAVDLQAGVGPGGAAVRGEVKVPEARIMPRTIPSGATQPSPDVVLEEGGDRKEPVPLHIDVLARLGDAVSIDAFGLRALLRGDLRVTKAPQKGLIGDGQLEVVEGTYRVTLPGEKLVTAIGKPLTIEQGIVVFAKTPIDNPGLILRAQREGGDLTAGVRVLGTIKSPKLAFFSESDPDLTQSEITSYLVTGVPPKRGAEADARALSVG
ncbi:MAG: translocation/assembly module TamB domain-containing protein, partial [Thiohalocapsa sp.]